ncbi:MAG TPA: AMP-binding protein, partial [Armatimonadota bacterium]|nr:AMP-binding protein [Armatimonadota bacterium]
MPDTINEIFQTSVSAFPDRPAVAGKVGDSYVALTYRELADRVQQFASGLAALGIAPGDTVALISENRPEWAVADLAILALGAVNVPMFPTLPSAQIEYIIRDSGSRWLVVSDAKQVAKALDVRATHPELRIITMDG